MCRISDNTPRDNHERKQRRTWLVIQTALCLGFAIALCVTVYFLLNGPIVYIVPATGASLLLLAAALNRSAITKAKRRHDRHALG